MAISVLQLPVDIPWRRIGVSLYMIDEEVCDKKRPLAMQPSVAVFQYDPDPESLAHRAVKMGGPFHREVSSRIPWRILSKSRPRRVHPSGSRCRPAALSPCSDAERLEHVVGRDIDRQRPGRKQDQHVVR